MSNLSLILTGVVCTDDDVCRTLRYAASELEVGIERLRCNPAAAVFEADLRGAPGRLDRLVDVVRLGFPESRLHLNASAGAADDEAAAE